jgi:hypothetical protein
MKIKPECFCTLYNQFLRYPNTNLRAWWGKQVVGGGCPQQNDQHLNLLFGHPNYLSGDSTNNGQVKTHGNLSKVGVLVRFQDLLKA